MKLTDYIQIGIRYLIGLGCGDLVHQGIISAAQTTKLEDYLIATGGSLIAVWWAKAHHIKGLNTPVPKPIL